MNIGAERGSNSQDFELNLASIIDCFTVLITFMLASASFLSVGILDAGISAAGASASTEAPPAVNVTVTMAKDKSITIKTSGKQNNTTTINSKNSTWDLDSLTSHLNSLKGAWPDLNAITLAADSTVEYRDVVTAMETSKKSLPVVLLGGF